MALTTGVRSSSGASPAANSPPSLRGRSRSSSGIRRAPLPRNRSELFANWPLHRRGRRQSSRPARSEGRSWCLTSRTRSSSGPGRSPAGRDLRALWCSTPTRRKQSDHHSLCLAVGSGQTVQLWDVTGDTPRAVDELLTGHLGVVQSFWVDPDQQTLFSAALDQSVIRWKLGPGGPLARALVNVAEQPLAIAFSGEGILATVCKGEGEIILWDAGHASKKGTATGELKRLIPVETREPVVCLSFSPDGTLLVTGDALGNVRFWRKNASSVESLAFREEASASIPAHKGRVNGLTRDSSGRFVVSFGEDKAIYRWSTDDLSHPVELRPIAFPRKISAVALHSDPKRSLLAVADFDRTIHVDITIDGGVASTKVLRGHVGQCSLSTSARTASFSPRAAWMDLSTCGMTRCVNTAPRCAATTGRSAASSSAPSRRHRQYTGWSPPATTRTRT